MFTSLLKLYQNHSSRIPLERFSCEVLCGVLKSDSNLTKAFLEKFAGISEENSFNIETEKTYLHNISQHNRRIDIVFENNNYLIFLEAKVNSDENDDNQLGTYAEILEQETEKKTILLYCTKYAEPKAESQYSPIKFKQLLWREIFSLVKTEAAQKSNGVAKEFLFYLEKQGMSKAPEFTLEDLSALNRIPDILKSLEECLDQIRPAFQENFGNIEPRSLNDKNSREKDSNHYYNQLYRKSRYALWREHPLKNKSAWSEILACITMNGDNKDNPRLVLTFWISKNHKEFESVKTELNNKQSINEILLSESEDGFSAHVEKSLSDFISSKQQFLDVKHWFEKNISLLHQYITNDSKLDWDIKN